MRPVAHSQAPGAFFMAGKPRLLENNGLRLSVSEWARRTGLHPNTITSRLRLGWSVADALGTPADRPAPLAAVPVPPLKPHRASGQSRVWWGGQYHYLGPTGDPATERAYRQFLREHVLAAPAPAAPPVPADPTVGELCAAFLRHALDYYRRHGRPTSEVYCYRQVAAALGRLYPRLPARDFGPRDLQQVRDQFLQVRGRNGRPWTREHVNHQTQRVKRVWSWGVERGLVPYECYAALTRVRGLRKGKTAAPEGGRPAPVPWEAVERTLPHMPEGLADLVRVHWLLGCRGAEARLMRVRDVDLLADPDGRLWLYRTDLAKTEEAVPAGQELTYWVGPAAQTILRPRLRGRDPAEYVFPGPAGHARTGVKKRHWTKDSYKNAVERACVAAGVPAWTPRQIRAGRADAVRLAEHAAGRPGREAAQALLGHRQISTTDEHYLQRLELARQVAGRLG